MLEICCDSVASAVRAQRGGADRLELCDCLEYGGLTPSAGKIKAVRKAVKIPVFVLIRPRKGDFLYTAEEFEVMLEDIAFAKQLGANGIVSGVLLQNGSVDRCRTAQLLEASYPLDFTFHRAIDASCDPVKSLQTLIEMKIPRVLTSGGSSRAVDSLETLKRMLEVSDDSIILMAGGGIRPDTLGCLISLGLTEFHSSASSTIHSDMQYSSDVSMGSDTSSEHSWRIVDEEMVLNMKTLLTDTKSK